MQVQLPNYWPGLYNLFKHLVDRKEIFPQLNSGLKKRSGNGSRSFLDSLWKSIVFRSPWDTWWKCIFLGPIPYPWNQNLENAKVLMLDRWTVPSIYFSKENLGCGFYYRLKDWHLWTQLGMQIHIFFKT